MTKVINESVEQLENLGIVEALFRSKQEYHDIYPYSFNVSSYDLERKDLFYGKLDKEGDIVFLDRQFLEGVEGSGDTTATVLDFVADAFFSFKVLPSFKSTPDSQHNAINLLSSALKSKKPFSYFSAKAYSSAIPLTAPAPLDDLVPKRYLIVHKGISEI